MFNIRNLVNRIAKAGEGDSGQGETSSSKSRSESVSSYSQETSSSAAAEAEGFLCPACYSNFTNPEELQLHYEQVHQDPGANYLCPVCKARLRNSLELEQHYAVNHMNQGPVKSGSLDDMRKELTSLNSTLLEERWQSEELRKEVENLKKMLQASGTSEESEAYSQQIQGLEESKALLMSEVLLLRKQLSEALESSSSLRSERDKLGEKLAKSSRDVAELQASLDETQGMKAALQERVNLMENQLSQRENVDDAGVLKRELASVQRMMDQLSKDKEEELDQMKTLVKDLQSQQEVSTNELNALRESFEALQRFADSVQEEKNKLQADLENVELTKLKLQETEQQLSQMQTLRDETDICVAKLREEVTSLQVMLNQARHEAEGEVSAKQDELLQLKLQLLNHQQQVARLESSCESLQAENKDLRQELIAGKNLLESELRSKQAKESELKDVEQKQQKLQQKLLILEKEKDELVMKISAGEGLNTAIEQLQSQNQALQLEIQEGSQNLATFKNQHDEIVNEKLKLESQMEVLKQQLAETNEENAAKDKRIEELVGMTESLKEEALKAEKSWNTDKEKLQKKLEDSVKAKEGLENQLQSLSAEKNVLEKENSRILEKQKELESQLSNQMKSYEALELESDNSKIKYSEAVTLIAGQETKIQELTNQIAILTGKLDQSNNEEIRLKTAMDQLENSMEMLKKQSETSLNEMEDKLKLMTETNGRYELTNQQLQEEVQQLKEDLTASTAKGEALDKQAEAQVQRIANLEKMISGKDVILHDNQQTIESLNAEIVRDKSRIAEMEGKLQLLDKEKRSLAALLESEQNARTKEKRDHEEAEQLLKGEKESLETLTTHLQNQMDELRTEHRIHLQRLKNDMDAVSEEKNQLATQLATAKEVAENEKASREETKARLESQIKSLTLQLAKVNEELGSRTKRCDELQSLVEQSRGRTLELEAQAAVLEEDKKELQSRCGQWEVEAEKIKMASVELRRRLEDSQSALHELGRENQSLQMENAKLQDRKWADDSEVRQCLGCSKDFSITVRKHHCRNCGQIFCSDCSAKQTPIGQSKKPVRVCDPCFKELQNSR